MRIAQGRSSALEPLTTPQSHSTATAETKPIEIVIVSLEYNRNRLVPTGSFEALWKGQRSRKGHTSGLRWENVVYWAETRMALLLHFKHSQRAFPDHRETIGCVTHKFWMGMRKTT